MNGETNVRIDERGDVIISGMLKTLLFLLLTALLVYEVGAVLVNSVQLDEIADDAARAAAQAAGGGATVEGVEQAVLASLADQSGVVLDSVAHDKATATVAVSREPLFLVSQRIPPLRERFAGRATHTAAIR
jgi:uncharacterized membrane protein